MDEIEVTNVTGKAVSKGVRLLLGATFSNNTKKAYQSDIRSFLNWGGSIPSNPNEIARYIAENSPRLSIATIRRHISALTTAHSALESPDNPVKHPLVTNTLKGASRVYGAPQSAVRPLLIDELRRILDLKGDCIIDRRNSALLTIGFAGGFRRSELVALDFENIEERPEGLAVTISKSKTDQDQVGRLIGIPFGRGPYCPVRYYRDWIKHIDETSGPVFRGCLKGGGISSNRLSGEAVAKVVKASVKQIGNNPAEFSGHSLRAGFVTSAVAAGVRNDIIRKQTGHASDQTMERYIRDGSLFTTNALSSLF